MALGATVLEKPFTLSRHLPATDHEASMLPEELGTLCEQARELGEMLGDGVKAPCEEELAIRELVRSRFRDVG